jgi:hypothetical protein
MQATDEAGLSLVRDNMNPWLGSPLLTLSQAALHLQWSRRTLVRKLRYYGIPTIGKGRLARIESADLENLKQKERETVKHPSAAEEAEQLRMHALRVEDARLRSYYRRRAAQLTRKPSKPKT